MLPRSFWRGTRHAFRNWGRGRAICPCVANGLQQPLCCLGENLPAWIMREMLGIRWERQSLVSLQMLPHHPRVKILPRRALAVPGHSRGTRVAAAALLNLENPGHELWIWKPLSRLGRDLGSLHSVSCSAPFKLTQTLGMENCRLLSKTLLVPEPCFGGFLSGFIVPTPAGIPRPVRCPWAFREHGWKC